MISQYLPCRTIARVGIIIAMAEVPKHNCKEAAVKSRRVKLAALSACAVASAVAVAEFAHKLGGDKKQEPQVAYSAGDVVRIAPGVRLHIGNTRIYINDEDIEMFQRKHWHEEIFIWSLDPNSGLKHSPYINITPQKKHLSQV
jgi:hypothetical protein